MKGGNIFRNLTPYSEGSLLKAIGDRITKIKADSAYTWPDMSRFFGGKDKTMVAKYSDATADMPITAFVAAGQSFGPSFLDSALNIIGYRAVPTYYTCTEDAPKVRLFADLIGDIAEILPEGVSDAELIAKAETIEAAGAAIDEFRARLHAARNTRVRAA